MEKLKLGRYTYTHMTKLQTTATAEQLQKQPPEVFCKKGVLRNFTKFTGKHLCQSLFFNVRLSKYIKLYF